MSLSCDIIIKNKNAEPDYIECDTSRNKYHSPCTKLSSSEIKVFALTTLKRQMHCFCANFKTADGSLNITMTLVNLSEKIHELNQSYEMLQNEVKSPNLESADTKLDIESIYAEFQDREHRLRNVIIYGINEDTYYGFNVENIQDPLERSAWETMVRTYGQTPRQLFRAAHPMVVQTLSSHSSSTSMRPVIPSVRGLVWGSYVGSPSDPEPSIVWKHQHKTPVASLIPLLTNDVFGLAPQTSLLLEYSKGKGHGMLNTIAVLGAALVTWNHSDFIIRAKVKKDQAPVPVVKSGGLDPICACATVPDCNQLWLGHSSGKLVVYEYKFDPGKGALEFRNEPVTLLGHFGTIRTLHICRSFSVVASGSQDSSTILWDLNNISYVRSTPKVGSPVSLVCVSETVGDIATVCHSVSCCTLRLYTINTSLVGSVNTSVPITALCFSSAPEGISVNVIATGMANGRVRLWSTWDLTMVREITCNSLNCPIISLTYSCDSQHLYASTADGVVVIWEGAEGRRLSRTPKFLNLTSL